MNDGNLNSNSVELMLVRSVVTKTVLVVGRPLCEVSLNIQFVGVNVPSSDDFLEALSSK